MEIPEIIKHLPIPMITWYCGCGFNSNEKHLFFFIQGNILVGEGGGVIGDNFDEDGNLQSVTVICSNCLQKALEEAIPKAKE